MRKIIITEFLTLDGVMEAPGTEKGFTYGGWSIPYLDEAVIQQRLQEAMAADAMLLGERTYRIFADFWPNSDFGNMSEQMNRMTKYVVSTTLKPKELTWEPTIHIKGNVPEEIGKIKQESGADILVYGSGVLAQTLIQHDLVDEYRLMIHPIVLAQGDRLFREGLDRKTLKLESVKSFPSGVVQLNYRACKA